ncbi:T9SS type A sorting domain-containing protein [Flavobacterium sp. Sd200]|uniref:endonuclease n=1 Tax=Flavobacterium sp. Sd200 TaxID=2692211 RepID=UPI00136DAE2E|nr:endonuclease [Flavobacterium sp. Sd200]MXN89875.1 T9SS type A sorting domain-containing protein [Flavobacterium sp. Sd200]
MKKTLLLFLLPFYCLAQIPEYYSTIDFTLTGDALKDELAELITETHTTELIYTPDVWNALRQSDLDPDNPQNVLLFYGYNDTDNVVSNDRTRDVSLSCNRTGSCIGYWVREHVYAQSLGEPDLEREGPGSDAHHLRAIDSQMNGSRNNRKFTAGSGNSHTLPGDLFYPGDEWKGDVARMMMYMYVRYQEQCAATRVGTGSTDYSTFGDMPDIFLEWNVQDPVSQYERNRNTVLEGMQGNRNPFIDEPYLATLIWNGPNAQDNWQLLATEEYALNTLVVYPTVTTGKVYLQNATAQAGYTYIVYNSLGQQANMAVSNNEIDIDNNAPGMYFINIKNGSATKTFKVILN